MDYPADDDASATGEPPSPRQPERAPRGGGRSAASRLGVSADGDAAADAARDDAFTAEDNTDDWGLDLRERARLGRGLVAFGIEGDAVLDSAALHMRDEPMERRAAVLYLLQNLALLAAHDEPMPSLMRLVMSSQQQQWPRPPPPPPSPWPLLHAIAEPFGVAPLLSPSKPPAAPAPSPATAPALARPRPATGGDLFCTDGSLDAQQDPPPSGDLDVYLCAPTSPWGGEGSEGED